MEKDQPSDVRLTLHVEMDNGQYPEGIPHKKGDNSSTIELEGKEALHFLSKMQKDFDNNKTRI